MGTATLYTGAGTTGQSVRLCFPAYRVYIYGQDVTDDVTSVSVNYNDGRSPNRCTVSLANQFDKYVINENDILYINNRGGGPGVAAGERLAQSINDLPKWLQDDMKLYINSMGPIGDDPQAGNSKYVKANVLLSKTDPSNLFFDSPRPVDEIKKGDPTTATSGAEARVLRYPFEAGRPIFHPNDPIRVFFRDPWDTKTWYHMFAGFLSDFDENTDQNNKSSLRIVAEDPTKLFRYARITSNPGLLDKRVLTIAGQDAIIPTAYANAFHDMTLGDIIFTLIFGPDIANTLGQFKSFNKVAPDGFSNFQFNGVGHFNIKNSRLFRFGSSLTPTTVKSKVKVFGITTQVENVVIPNNAETQVSTLAEYQSYIDHRVTFNDIFSMADPSIDINGILFGTNLATTEDIIDFIGKRYDIYKVDGGKVCVLLPDGIGQDNKRIIEKDPIGSFALTTEWTSRANILYSLAERVHFSFYASPKGDLIFEFPLYDYTPDDFKSPESTKNDDIPILYDYSKMYDIPIDEFKNVSSTISDDKVYTQAAANAAIIQNWNLGYTGLYSAPEVITLYHIVPLYGVRNAPITPQGYIESKDGARLYASIVLNKLNADSHVVSVHSLPNHMFWINRPVHIHGRNIMTTLKSISHTISWPNRTVSTDITGHMARAWTGAIDSNGNLIYASIGGKASTPLNYKLLFQRRYPERG